MTTLLTEYYYPNLTLASLQNNLSVNVFLPSGVAVPSSSSPIDNEGAYYESSRFEHGSMIGPIRLHNNNGGKEVEHVLYGSNLWRVPHDSHWTESGIGLASEFGFGNDGSHCYIGGDTDEEKCATSWFDETSNSKKSTKVTNGLLGYDEAKAGESFLKIGVGELIKGSCSDCDIRNDDDAYRFNSPYSFVTSNASSSSSTWKIISISKHHHDQHDKKETNSIKEIVMEQKAILGGDKEHHHDHHHRRPKVGYHLKKTISVHSNILSVTSQLTNLGDETFVTPWYSHHFFTCDNQPVGPGYSLQLGLKPLFDEENSVSYQESGVGIWSTPINEYASVFAVNTTDNNEYDSIEIQMHKEIEEDIKIKTEFPKHANNYGDASFILRACDVSMKEDIPELKSQQQPRRLQQQQQQHRHFSHHKSHKHKKKEKTSSKASSSYDDENNISMFAYNLYMEHGTISPEPIILVELEPGQSKQWTQRIEINLDSDNGGVSNNDGPENNNDINTIENGKEGQEYLLVNWEENDTALQILEKVQATQQEIMKSKQVNAQEEEDKEAKFLGSISSPTTFSVATIVTVLCALLMWMKKQRWNMLSRERERKRRHYFPIQSCVDV